MTPRSPARPERIPSFLARRPLLRTIRAASARFEERRVAAGTDRLKPQDSKQVR